MQCIKNFMKRRKQKKKLVLLINVKGALASWQISAHMKHLVEGLKPHLRAYEVIIMPVVDQPTTLYWLDGNADDLCDVKTFDNIKDIIKPVLHDILEECLEIKPSSLVVPNTAQEKMQELLMKNMSELEKKIDESHSGAQT
jgi:hypothetical protein